MALATLNGEHVLDAEIVFPRVGAWTARASVQSQGLAAGAATLKIGDSSIGCYAHRAAVYQGRGSALLVGGKGGNLEALTTARAFRPTPVRLLLESALGELGETLSSSSSSATLQTFVPRWTRLARPCGVELTSLAELLGAAWRCADDGGIYFGVDTYPALELPDRLVISDDTARRRMVIAGSLVHRMRPGVTFEGRKIVGVTLRLGPETTRAELAYV